MSLIPPATAHLDPAAAPTQPPENPRSTWRPLRWLARGLLVLVLIAWSLLLIAWLTLHWGILPHIQQWREPIEQRASRALGVPVSIGGIAVRSSGWVPSFELREVVLLGPDKQPALRLPRVYAAISPRSILSLELRFEQLLIDGAQLEVQRDAAGRISVGGLDLSGPSAGDGSAAADWFFAQHEFVIRGGSLRWTDLQRGAEPLMLTDVRLVIRNGLRGHDLRLDATPPPEWGDRFTAVGRFAQPLLARRGDWRRWNGTAYADLPRADLHALRQHVTLPFDLDEGVGAVRGWLDVRAGEPSAATVDLALRAVKLRLAPDVDPLTIQELEGRLTGQRNADGLSLAARHFTFETGDDLRWPQGDMRFSLRQKTGQPASGGSFSAQRLDIGLMAQVASRVPLGAPLRKLLLDLDPKALVDGLDTTWDGPLDAPTRYRVQGNLQDLSVAARPAADPHAIGRPGLHGATVRLDASERGGSATVAINGGAIELPGVFDDPSLVLDQLAAQVLWSVAPAPAGQPALLTVQVQGARFANADASGELSALWRSGPGLTTGRGGRFPGRLELDAKLVDGVAARTPRYLPIGIPKDTRDYLANAIQGGKIASASFHVKGDLWDFPYFSSKPVAGLKAGARDGEFRITGKIENAEFAFVPGTAAAPSPWPTLTRTRVDLDLEHDVLELRNGSTRLGGVDFPKVDLAIRNLDGDPVLSLDGNGRGALADMLKVVNGSPINGWIGKALDGATATGPADLQLGLVIPLKKIETTAVKGSVQLAGNDLRIAPDTPQMAGAKGRVDFSDKGFAVVGASAKLFGGDATFDGASQPDGAVRFNGQGSVSAEGLRRAADLGPVARAASALSGQASYRASLAFLRGQSEISVTSNLVGLGIDLPAPLGKTAEVPLPLHYATSLDPGTGPALRDTLRLDLGNLVQAIYQRELGGAAPQVLRGGIGVLEPAPLPSSGVAAAVTLPRLATDEWEGAATRLFGDADAAAATTGPADYQPASIALRVQDFYAGQRHLTHLSAGLSQSAGTWRANLDADQLAGYVEYRLPVRRAGPAAAGGRVYARLSRLSIPKDDEAQVESLLDQQPATLPALDVIVDDVDLHGKDLGRVEIEALNRSTPQGRDWQLSKFNITTAEAKLVATGNWAVSGGPPTRGLAVPRRTVMDFRLQIADSGALLTRLGTSGAIRGGKGVLSGQIGWTGSPFALDYPSLTGQVNVAVDSGQFLKVEPGAARLLGVLSLQSLPRRLSLDFRDLFQEGFAFDNITGDVAIADGVARTNNLRMRGVQALVLMEGSADIARETQDLRAVVVPEINAGTAALAYAVINPAIGLGAFLAQAILKKPLTEAGTREFRITGPWADPKVERVERKSGDDVPAAK